jgi:nucleoside-diphosphate-sugar epimerase
VNVDAAVGLYRAARRAGCQRFVFISSVAVYGVHGKRRKPVSEETARAKGSRWDFYMRSKTLAEQSLLHEARNGGPELAILRPGILYSEDGRRLASRSITVGGKRIVVQIGSGRNHLPFTRVETLVRCVRKMLQREEFPSGVFNLTGESRETRREFVTRRMVEMGLPFRILTMPAFPLRMLCWVVEIACTVTLRKKAPRLTRYAVDSSTRDYVYDCSKAEKAFQWNPREAAP